MSGNKLFRVPEIREYERFTMGKEQISSLELMEQAGEACAEEIASALWMNDFENVYVYVGTGNNGGDGNRHRKHEHYPDNRRYRTGINLHDFLHSYKFPQTPQDRGQIPPLSTCTAAEQL